MNRKKIIIIISSVLLIGLSLGWLLFFNSKDNKVKSNLESITILKEANSKEMAELIKKNIVKVVNTLPNKTQIIGTGFFDESGYLVTNSHIVDIKGDIKIIYPDNSEDIATLYSNDIISDISLLSVNKPRVKALVYANTININITDELYAVGFLYNLDGEASVTKGILSARRSAGGIEFLQTDINMDTGNSGGPLINALGEVVGINTYASKKGNLGMSISSESLKAIINNLLNNKKEEYISKKREKNALSVVLSEIGHVDKDIYNENNYLEPTTKDSNSKEKNEVTKPKNQRKSSDTGFEISLKGGQNSSRKCNETYGSGSRCFSLKSYSSSISISDFVVKLNSKAAIYNIEGNTNLNEGYNKFVINVTAENGNQYSQVIGVYNPKRTIDNLGNISIAYAFQSLRITVEDKYHNNITDESRYDDAVKKVTTNFYVSSNGTKGRLLYSKNMTDDDKSNLVFKLFMNDTKVSQSILYDQLNIDDYSTNLSDKMVAQILVESTIETYNQGTYKSSIITNLEKPYE